LIEILGKLLGAAYHFIDLHYLGVKQITIAGYLVENLTRFVFAWDGSQE
jgi:hypothetical protein